jgi:hypothetical protein
MGAILDLAKTGNAFKYGSGTGSNLSCLRGLGGPPAAASLRPASFRRLRLLRRRDQVRR